MYMANQAHIYNAPSTSTITVTAVPPLTSGTNSIYTTNNTNAITINSTNANTMSYYDQFAEKSTIQIGGQELDGERLRKLDALLSALDSLKDDNALKELYNIQLMLNKIKGRK
jgi:hypothetical protein